MKPFLIIVLGAAVLAGCAGQPRTDAPAPVASSRNTAPRLQTEQVAETQQVEEQTVEVYAYRPPLGAPDALPPETEFVDTSGDAGSMIALPTERATALPADRPQSQPGVPVTTVRSEVAPPPAPEVVAYAPPPPPTPDLPPAASGLAAQAEQQRQMGDYVGAAATLERALRIQPQEAYLWNRLARIRMEQGRYAQAGNLAQRSNALANDQPQLKQDNWSMIAVARRTSGDAAGGMEAEERARGG